MASGQGSAEGMPPVARALDAAEARCLRAGAQLTELRRQVLALVLESEQPLGAYALLDKLKAKRPGAAPPTVYRALDFLLEQGLIHKVERLNAFIGCVEVGHAHGHDHHHAHPHQFLICRECGMTLELSDHAVAHALEEAVARAGFRMSRATVEVEGLCAACAGGAS
ncbi:transcriptional repressor [Roseomonas sp. GC11]|uniref:Fur family transcriptional regulator n=1 Tax=Roseomonas sp. GC11 TaxID=2950546 RepID=UPI00210C0061|nr:Fur family transcriptional regulator [Roseomonas sp. GC11]MCQ4159009.1 transcriptional repressor [Roseomonas sp. GC11]